MSRAQNPSSKTYGRLTHEEEKRLARRWKKWNDRRALEALIRPHMGLAVRVALEYRNSGVPLEDLIQEGYVGLTIGAQRFDPERGHRLSTYANWWIRCRILEAVVRSHGAVRIGTTQPTRSLFFNMGKARRQLETGTAEPATAAAIAKHLRVDEADVLAMLPRLSHGADVSLDCPAFQDDKKTRGDLLRSNGVSPEEAFGEVEEDRYQRRAMREALRALSVREQAIIRCRFLRKKPLTFKALATHYGISRERVRQIELKAVKKIRKAVGAEQAPEGSTLRQLLGKRGPNGKKVSE